MAQSKLTDMDSPWKDALEQFLPACMELYFPEAYRETPSPSSLWRTWQFWRPIRDRRSGLRRSCSPCADCERWGSARRIGKGCSGCSIG